MAGTYHNSFQKGALGLASGAASTRTDIEIWQHPRNPLLATVFAAGRGLLHRLRGTGTGKLRQSSSCSDRKTTVCPQVGRPAARMLTPCNHFFHSKCLHRWMDVKMECPTCRRMLPPP